MAIPRSLSISRRPAFSLIELIVVIAIIAVLVSISLPALAGARDAARKTACAANLRSLGQIIELYRDDHKRRYPVARYMPPPWLSGSPDPPLNTALAKYIEDNLKSWRCPGDRVVAAATYTDADSRTRECGVSYMFITALSGQTLEETFFFSRLSMPPDQIPVMHDYDGGTFETQDGGEVAVPFFHRTRNILFADTHVGEYRAIPTDPEG